jgi:serine/threonine protein phosphatase PrpC
MQWLCQLITNQAELKYSNGLWTQEVFSSVTTLQYLAILSSYQKPTFGQHVLLNYHVRLGTQSLSHTVIADPEIKEDTIEEGVDFLVLATAGLWNVVSNQEAVSMVQSIPDAKEAARFLTDKAFRRGSNDSITCVVVRFQNKA